MNGNLIKKYEPYYSIDINNSTANNSINLEQLNETYLRLYESTIDIDFNNNKIVINATNFIDENGNTRIMTEDNIQNEISISDTALQYLTATIENTTIKSFQLERYNERNPNHPIILSIFPQNKTYFAPFNYANRINLITNLSENILNGKKMCGLGDSLIAGSNLGNTATSLYKIAEKNNMVYTNYGVNGNPIAKSNNYSQEAMCERYTEMDNNLDYIVVLGGANDRRLNIPIGSNDSSDLYTFKGALNTLIKGLLTKYPGKKILFLTNYNRIQGNNDIGLSDKDYVDAMIEMCELYAIPCFDNYRKCGISWYTDLQEDWADETASSGGSANMHLSDEAYDFLVPVYENLLKSI